MRYTVSVVIPTYKRPDYLEKCIRAIFVQSRIPDEIVLVSREDDEATNEKIMQLMKEFESDIPIINPHVKTPGFLPPIKKGIETATKDIVAFLDDDCEPYPDWLEILLSNYKSEDIGGVGGRCISWWNGKLIYVSPAKKASYITWYGTVIGNMYRDLTFDYPVEACTLIGGNCSYRSTVLQRVSLDFYLNEDVAVGWELDLAFGIKKLGYKLLFDPKAKVNHYTAPREKVGMRPGFGENEMYYNFRNRTYTLCKYLNFLKKAVFLTHTLLIGGRGDPGLFSGIMMIITKHSFRQIPIVKAALKGKIDGFLASFHSHKAE